MAHLTRNINFFKRDYLLVIIVLLVTLLSSLLAVQWQQFYLPLIPVVMLGIVIFIILLFRDPLIGLYTAIAYSFLFGFFDREIGGGIPYGTFHDLLGVLTWISVWYNKDRYDFSILKNSFIWLTLVWFCLSCFQLINPAGSHPLAWMQEMRTIALYPLLFSALGVLLLNDHKKLNTFIILILALSLLAAVNGIKQLHIGPSPGEQRFLDEGGALTHLVTVQLRVFSFMSDAGQFGASQAQFVVIAIVMAIGINSFFKRAMGFVLAFVFFYGMLISGTRGALFALVGGIFMAIVLSKNYRVMIFGGAVSLFLLFILKFTYVGNSNFIIYRLRTAVDPQDASLNLRFINQERLAEYLSTKPFGGGLGSIGYWASKYNEGSYLSSIAPDSFWVKVWAMYGIVGMIIFFCMWMFVFGKCSGMLWNMKDKILKTKLIALTSGAFGVFLCSYGNEVMNVMPTLEIFQVSLGAVFGMCSAYYKNEAKSKMQIN